MTSDFYGPCYPVHIVVIPKRHIASLVALTAEDDVLLSGIVGYN
jgi:diadenosine tetraphosphate (Ap4A) HIT family hydrolase